MYGSREECVRRHHDTSGEPEPDAGAPGPEAPAPAGPGPRRKGGRARHIHAPGRREGQRPGSGATLQQAREGGRERACGSAEGG